jgi:hypothetical protein
MEHHAHDLVPGLSQKRGGHGTVDAAREGDKDARRHYFIVHHP